MKSTVSVTRLSTVFALFLLICLPVQAATILNDLFSFGNELDKLEAGMTYSEVVELLGEGELKEYKERNALSLTYNTGLYAGIHLSFQYAGDEAELVSILFFDAFTLKTESGIGIGMSKNEVLPLIGNPLFKAEMSTRTWESYYENGFVIHVEYDKDGVVTNLYKIDRTKIQLPGQ